MTPRLLAVHFGDGHDQQWPRLARVLAYTAAQHCAHWSREIRLVTPPPLTSALGIDSHVHNTQKMEAWAAAVQAAPDGVGVLLMDADMMIVRPLDDVWTEDFDFGYTTKASRFPFNSGVVFVRVSPAVRAFFEVWRAENRRMLGDRVHHQVWRAKYGGINQAALGFALESNLAAGLRVRTLPCTEWNCEDSSWASFDPAVTRIVHVKSMLRRIIFNLSAPNPRLRPLVQLWRQLERDAAALADGARRAVAV